MEDIGKKGDEGEFRRSCDVKARLRSEQLVECCSK